MMKTVVVVLFAVSCLSCDSKRDRPTTFLDEFHEPERSAVLFGNFDVTNFVTTKVPGNPIWWSGFGEMLRVTDV